MFVLRIVAEVATAYYAIGLLSCLILALRWPHKEERPDFLPWLLLWPVMSVLVWHRSFFRKLGEFACDHSEKLRIEPHAPLTGLSFSDFRKAQAELTERVRRSTRQALGNRQ